MRNSLALVLAAGAALALSGVALAAGTNWATVGNGASAYAPDTYEGYVSGRIIDGDDLSFWASANGSLPKSIQIDLGQARTVREVRWLQSDAYWASAVTVAYSDTNGSWTTAETITLAGGDETIILGTPRTARWWQFTATAFNSSGWHVFALELLSGVDPTPTAAPSSAPSSGPTAAPVDVSGIVARQDDQLALTGVGIFAGVLFGGLSVALLTGLVVLSVRAR